MNLFTKVIYPADLRAPWGQTYPSVVHRQPAGSGSGVHFTHITGLGYIAILTIASDSDIER